MFELNAFMFWMSAFRVLNCLSALVSLIMCEVQLQQWRNALMRFDEKRQVTGENSETDAERNAHQETMHFKVFHISNFTSHQTYSFSA